MPCAAIRLRASASVASGPSVIGLTTMPASNFLTFLTSSAWASGLRLRWTIADPAVLGHRDRELGLGHGIHRRRQERNAELDLAGQARADVDLGRQDLGVRGLEQDVIEGQRLSDRDRRPLHH